MKLSQAFALIEASYQSQTSGNALESVVLSYMSSPGQGKTSIVHQFVESKRQDNENFGLVILSLAQYDAGEIAGWLVEQAGQMVRLRPEWMPSQGEGVIFIDEWPQAPVANQNIMAQLVNERRIGEHSLPDGWSIVCAGNRMSDRAGTNQIPSHLRDRLTFVNVDFDLDEFVAHANKKGISPVLKGLARFRPELFNQFDKDAMAFGSPRSWFKVDEICKWGLDTVVEMEAVAGQVGEGNAAEYYGYKKVFDTCPDIDKEIVGNPSGAPIPDEPSVLYAVCAAIADRINPSNVEPCMAYLARLPHQEFAVFTIKDAFTRDNKLVTNAKFRQFMLDNCRELMPKR